jgi:ribosome recycling factor
MFTDDFQAKAQKVIDHLLNELRQIRTGRAQSALVEDVIVIVEAYGGAQMHLKELAGISAPDATMLLVQPYDPSVLKDIEKALNVAQLGINPVVDQNTIRLSIPPLTSERREQLAKVVSQKMEEAKVALRGVRTEVKDDIEDQKKTGGVSEDEIKRQLAELQKGMDAATAKIDAIGQDKQTELRTL